MEALPPWTDQITLRGCVVGVGLALLFCIITLRLALGPAGIVPRCVGARVRGGAAGAARRHRRVSYKQLPFTPQTNGRPKSGEAPTSRPRRHTTSPRT